MCACESASMFLRVTIPLNRPRNWGVFLRHVSHNPSLQPKPLYNRTLN